MSIRERTSRPTDGSIAKQTTLDRRRKGARINLSYLHIHTAYVIRVLWTGPVRAAARVCHPTRSARRNAHIDHGHARNELPLRALNGSQRKRSQMFSSHGKRNASMERHRTTSSSFGVQRLASTTVFYSNPRDDISSLFCFGFIVKST